MHTFFGFVLFAFHLHLDGFLKARGGCLLAKLVLSQLAIKSILKDEFQAQDGKEWLEIQQCFGDLHMWHG